MKRLTDGHGAVAGHHGDEEDAHSTRRVLSEELGHAAFQGDGSALGAGVHSELGGSAGRESDVQKGQEVRKNTRVISDSDS